MPGLVAHRYRSSRIVVFSTGNVYPLVPVSGPGARESDLPGPVGEYAQSALARERIFQHAAGHYGTRVAILRINYAIEPRYGCCATWRTGSGPQPGRSISRAG
ncbi:MAG: NAD-dependent epimerase/dehydratase family protein [Gemmatimonadales bacterium]